LIGQVAGHEVHTVGEVLPGAGNSRHASLPSELAVRTHLARYCRHLGCERVQLIHHGVDRGTDTKELAPDGFAFDLERHLLREVAFGDRYDHARDLRGRPNEVAYERVDRLELARPGSSNGPE